MARESEKVLNIRDFPLELRQKCKAKAALRNQTLKDFVEEVLREATKDMPDASQPKRR